MNNFNDLPKGRFSFFAFLARLFASRQPKETPLTDKGHPRFIKGYEAGLVDGRRNSVGLYEYQRITQAARDMHDVVAEYKSTPVSLDNRMDHLFDVADRYGPRINEAELLIKLSQNDPVAIPTHHFGYTGTMEDLKEFTEAVKHRYPGPVEQKPDDEALSTGVLLGNPFRQMNYTPVPSPVELHIGDIPGTKKQEVAVVNAKGGVLLRFAILDDGTVEIVAQDNIKLLP